MLETELKVNQFLLGYLRKLIGDIPDERTVEQPLPDVNHPAWILGHLAWSTDRARSAPGPAAGIPGGLDDDVRVRHEAFGLSRRLSIP